jgi:hypothetical protein
MKYVNFKIEIIKISDNDINIKNMKLFDEEGENYIDRNFIMSIKTIPEFIDVIGNIENVRNEKLEDKIIDNKYDKIHFRYLGSDTHPSLHIYNDHNFNGAIENSGVIVIPLEAELFIGEIENKEGKNIKLLVKELKKFIEK